MRIHRLSLILVMAVFLFACSTSPYLQKDSLPKSVIYYTESNKFKIRPDWYWRLRPDIVSVNDQQAVIGHLFLSNRSNNAIVIGEIIINNKKFYIAEWDNNGYFFIKEDDYIFAKKYQKYIVPLHYSDESLYQDPLSSYYAKFLFSPLEKITVNKENFYEKNIRTAVLNYYSQFKIFYLFEVSLFFENIRATGNINKEEFRNDILSQIILREEYSNKFLIIPQCYNFYEFIQNDGVRLYTSFFPSTFLQKTNYANPYGLSLTGDIYKTKYIVAQWGKVFYQIPIEKE